MKRRPKNLPVEGQRFGRYVIRAEVEPELRPNGRGNLRRVIAVCDCGTERTVHLQNLTSGKSQSCGCLSAVLASIREATHGQSDSAEYRIWRGMLNRCYNPKVQRYPNYGGRGIGRFPDRGIHITGSREGVEDTSLAADRLEDVLSHSDLGAPGLRIIVRFTRPFGRQTH